MRNYNFFKPFWIIAIAFLVNLFVTNLFTLLGSTQESAETIGFIAMIIAALVTFRIITKRRKRHKP